MTIAIGLICTNGLIMATDTMEVVGYAKRGMGKIYGIQSGDFTCVIAGSGDTTLIKMFRQAIGRDIVATSRKGLRWVEMEGVITAATKDLFTRNILPYPTEAERDRRTTTFLIGICIKGQTRLYFARPPEEIVLVRWEDAHTATGFGENVAMPLLAQFHQKIQATRETGELSAYIIRRVPAAPEGTAFRLYVEGNGSLQTGLAIANSSSTPATLSLNLFEKNGLPTGTTSTLSVPARGQLGTFLREVPGWAELMNSFQGTVSVVSNVPITILGLRTRYNERGDFLITALPPINELAASMTEAAIPHFADGGGYSTEFVLFSGTSLQAGPGVLRFALPSGQPVHIPMR
jgi:hypothetical protein